MIAVCTPVLVAGFFIPPGHFFSTSFCSLLIRLLDIFYPLHFSNRWAGVSQSVEWLATAWTNRNSVPDRGEIFLVSKSSGPPLVPTRLQNIETPSGAHSSPKHRDPLWGPLVFLFSSYEGSYPGVKRPGSDADYSRPSRDKVENGWSYTFTPPICLHGVDRDNFTFERNVFLISCTDLLIHNTVRFGIWISTCRRFIQLQSHIAAVCWNMLHSTLKMAAVRFSEKVMTIYQTIRHYTSQYRGVHTIAVQC